MTPEVATTVDHPAAATITNQKDEEMIEEDTSETYKGFGSFHSDNVQDLIALPDSEYRPPQGLPELAQFFVDDALTKRARQLGRHFTWEESLQVLGRPLRSTHYLLDPSWTFVNHGAFGGALKHGIAVKRHFEDVMEAQPLTFIDRQLLPMLVYSTRSLAKFIGASPSDVVLVANATFGLNAAINATLRHPTDVVAYLDTEYGSVWKMIRERCHFVGCSGHEIQISKYFRDDALMESDEAVTAYIESQLPANCTVFVVDHLASTSSIGLSVFTHIIPMLKRHGVKHIVVDGAHGPLQHVLDFNSLSEDQKPTVYVGNLHKWVSSPKAVGFIWAHHHIQKRLHSPVVSHGSRSGYLSEFIWDGTKDYGAYLAIPAVLDFWTNTIGVENARRYATELLVEAEALLCEAWGCKPVKRGAPFMKLIPLPQFLQTGQYSAKFIQDTLHARFKVEVPVKTVNGELFLRVSAFVNNCRADYETLRDSVNQLVSVLRKRGLEHPETTQTPSTRLPPRSECGGCGVPLGGVSAVGFSDDDE